MAEHKFTNALISAQSPYLLQHAHNPVNWVEWNDAILVRAKLEDKLILVSIGYSSCHWCHVMAHECFENEETAAIMNAHFICVKIDREERPDIDQIYMDALQLITGQGGWPLNMITLPDGRPLHGGTYFPKEKWESVLLSLHHFYEDKKEEAFQFATQLSNGIRKLDQFEKSDLDNNNFQIMMGLLNKWKLQFDLNWGGYNWSPKFPLPNQWELFMGIHHLSKEPIFAEAVKTTLHKMYEGGIFDHLAGGFARYSTDSFWKVPHFEKMLYDNAQLLGTYAMAAKYFNEPIFEKVVAHTHQFICNFMTTPNGGFYSALDADSEGIEGKYYVWEFDELHELLEENAPLFCDYFSVTKEANWEEGNILFRTKTMEELTANYQLTTNEIEQKINQCRKLLLLERGKRIAPGLDDKIICSWNALMIKGYAQAHIYLPKENYLEQATNAMESLLYWCLEEKQVFRICKNNQKSIPGFAEDYACLIEALLTLFEAGASEKYCLLAQELMDECIKQFMDENTGLFFFTSAKQQILITRKIEINDDVIPASNSILAKCLNRLSYYFERNDYAQIQANMIGSILPKMQKFPNGYSNWMQLIAQEEMGFKQVIVKGKEAINWKNNLSKSFQFNTVILIHTEETKIPLMASKNGTVEKTTAWLCTNKTCSAPIYTIEALQKILV